MASEHQLFKSGVSRRDFMKTCVAATAVMGLPFGMAAKVAAAAQAPDRPPVIWLHFQECTGCSESLFGQRTRPRPPCCWR